MQNYLVIYTEQWYLYFYFSRIFKDKTGQSPKEFKTKEKNEAGFIVSAQPAPESLSSHSDLWSAASSGLQIRMNCIGFIPSML